MFKLCDNVTVCLVLFFYKLKPTRIIVTKVLHGPMVTQMNTSVKEYDSGTELQPWKLVRSSLIYSHNSIIDKDSFSLFFSFYLGLVSNIDFIYFSIGLCK